jgi:preprotein translocase subunit YajC
MTETIYFCVLKIYIYIYIYIYIFFFMLLQQYQKEQNMAQDSCSRTC